MAPKPSTLAYFGTSWPRAHPMTGRLISPFTAAALCMMPRGRMTERQLDNVDALKAAPTDFCMMSHFSRNGSDSHSAQAKLCQGKRIPDLALTCYALGHCAGAGPSQTIPAIQERVSPTYSAHSGNASPRVSRPKGMISKPSAKAIAVNATGVPTVPMCNTAAPRTKFTPAPAIRPI